METVRGFVSSGNQPQGSLPIPLTSMVVYQVSNNLLAGGIPHQMCRATGVAYYDASNNYLSGQIPDCINELGVGGSLLVLNSQGNKFDGTIPQLHPKFWNLRMINLAWNQLQGQMC